MTRDDTGEPVPNISVNVDYLYMLVLNPPKSTTGTTDSTGRVVLPIADFDMGPIHLQAGDFGTSITADTVRMGGTVSTSMWSTDPTGTPKLRLRLASDKRSVLERLFGYPPRFGWTTLTVPQVESQVDHALPVGSTRQEIEAWLAIQGLEFSYVEKAGWRYLRQELNGEVYHGAIVSIIRDTDRSLLVTGDIQVYFLLDSDGRLSKRLVEWVGTGL